MQQNDDVVMGWLGGLNSVGGLDNPAGPLYIDASTEQKMTDPVGGAIRLTHATTQSCAAGCDCC